ncbi:MAG: hypothetical protein J6W10_05730 [Kiritimatiellae bacterium]|nr:hypothetical protein [Kiritimatiellia bacterium]
MTAEQLEECEACKSEICRVLDVLELHELRLRKFSDVKADPSDPYSIDIEEVADGIYLCRDNLNDTLDLLKNFKEKISE